MADKPKEIKVNLDPNLYALTFVKISFAEEHFQFLLNAGNQARQFLATPKHSKRIHLLLERSIAQYEKQFGKIETHLPKKKEATQEQELGFVKK